MLRPLTLSICTAAGLGTQIWRTRTRAAAQRRRTARERPDGHALSTTERTSQKVGSGGVQLGSVPTGTRVSTTERTSQ